MARLNRKPKAVYTHEGGKATKVSAEKMLRRSVMSCLLWEKEFYEDGESISKRVEKLVSEVSPEVARDIAIEARNEMYLRHMPLFIAVCMARLKTHRHLLDYVLYHVIQRPDELAEFLAMYWKDGKCPLANKVKKGLAMAFTKFDEYQFAKWNKKREIRIKDVMFMCHPKPRTKEQEVLFNKIANDNLATPDTWEVALSSGGDKRSHWTRLIKERKLGGMATLMNLRNMENVGVDPDLIKEAIVNMSTSKVLPFRFVTATRMVPSFEPELEYSMLNSLAGQPKMGGHTVLLVDVSGSMDQLLSYKSTTNRIDVACGLAILLREICEHVDIYSFSLKLKKIPPRRGFALRDAILNSQEHNATYLGTSVKAIYAKRGTTIKQKGYFHGSITMHGQGLNPDRLIVITDEQSHDKVPAPNGTGYMINVASYQYGVGYGKWIHCDGWSDSIVRWIQAIENFGD